MKAIHHSLHCVTRSSIVRAAFLASISVLAANANAQFVYSGPATAGTNQWGNAANWSPNTVPNAQDATVNIPYGVATEIEIDVNYTIGSLTASNGASITLPTKPTSFDPAKGLTLSTSSGTPTIDVGDPASNVFAYCSIFGTQGFEKIGVGRFTFRFNSTAQTYTGNVRITGGTLGINQDSSLGNVDNDLFIGSTGASPTATLIAEPGSNTGTVTLPASRTINLIGDGARLSTSAAAINLAIEGTITDNGGNYGFIKTGAGSVVLLGSNNYTGSTTVDNGALVVAKAAALPGYNVAGKVIGTGSGSVVARVGGVGEWTSAEVNALATNASFGSDAALGFDTSNATGVVEVSGLTAAQNYNLAKYGAGTLRLTGVNNFTGTGKLRLFGGTLEVGSGASLPTNLNLIYLNTGANVSTLDLGGTSLAISNFTEAPGAKSVATNGALNFTGDTNFDVTGTNGTIVDLSGLQSFSFSRNNRALRVLPTSAATPVINELTLAAAGAGSNVIDANNVQIGGAAGTSQGTGHEGRLHLGKSNLFKISGTSGTLQVGGFNGSGKIDFQSGLTGATVTLRGGDGIAALPLWKIGETSSGTRTGAGVVDLTGGSVDALVGDLILSRHISVSANSETSSLTMSAGTINATRLILGQKENGGANPPSPTFDDPYLNSTVTVNGGSLTAGTVLLGDAKTGANAGSPNPGATNYIINVNLNGGTLAAGAIGNTTGTFVNAFDEAETVRNFNFNGGVLTHLAGQDLLVSGTLAKDADPLTTGNLVTFVARTGGGSIDVAAGRRVTLDANTRIISQPPALPADPQPIHTLGKTGAGNLVVNGSVSDTVRLRVDGGALVVDNGAVPALLDVNATAILAYNGTSPATDVIAKIVAGYNGGAWDGTGYTSSGAAQNSKYGIGYAEATELYASFPAPLNGYDVDNTTFVLKYTLKGDLNLDGTVNFDDLLKLAQNYGGTGKVWTTGDMNYDAAATFDDLLALAQNYGMNAVSSAQSDLLDGFAMGFSADWSAAQALVPEPVSMMALAAPALLLRRRR